MPDQVRHDGSRRPTLEAHLVVDVADVAAPLAMVAIEEHFGRRLAAGDDLAERVEEAAFILADRVEAVARLQPRVRDGEDALAKIAQAFAGRSAGGEAELRHAVAQALAFVQGPVLHL